tara:strand:- start:62 stop:550 length:489 start_codon:yes stop_codon:yes gene_type:complete
MSFDYKKAVNATRGLSNSSAITKEATDTKQGSLITLIAELKKAEDLGIKLSTFKQNVYDAEGYTYKVWNEDSEKTQTVDGVSAPPAVSTAYSEAKRSVLAGNKFNDFKTWEDMRKAFKPEDKETKIKALFKTILKDTKKLDNGWHEYVEGALTKLQAELPKK